MTQTEFQPVTEASGKVIYTAKSHTTGGRENGVSRSYRSVVARAPG